MRTMHLYFVLALHSVRGQAPEFPKAASQDGESLWFRCVSVYAVPKQAMDTNDIIYVWALKTKTGSFHVVSTSETGDGKPRNKT
jgi:hypothetical protein